MRRVERGQPECAELARRGIVIGYPYYARRLACLMNEHSTKWRMRAFQAHRWDSVRALVAVKNLDMIVCFGGPAPDAALTAMAQKYGVPILVVWAGSDVIHARERPQELQVIKEEGFHHIADGAWLVDELAVLGLTVEYEPLTDVYPGDAVRPFPSQFRVLTHLPAPRRDFYGENLVYDVARRMPDVAFIVIGSGGKNEKAPSNVQFCGYVRDAQRWIDDATVVLRVPQHDGKSMLVLEALARARHVVWNYEFPHVVTAKTLEEIVHALQSMQASHERSALPLNLAGRRYALSNFGREKIARSFEARLDALVSRPQPSSPAKQVAISGLSIFCADVAGYTRQISPAWKPRLLRPNSRLGVLTAMAAISQCDVWYTIGNPVDRWMSVAARLLRKPRVIHWVGSDILALSECPDLAHKLQRRDILHLAETDWTARELRDFGLSARIVPLPPRRARRHYGSCEPLPEIFTVLLYVPRTRQEFYGARQFERLMHDLRDKRIRYVIVGGGSVRLPQGIEATDLGWCNDLQQAYREASVLVRFTEHDGLSLMVLEALSYGRHVVWTRPFNFVRYVRDYASLRQEVLALYEAHERGALGPQRNASDFINQRYSPSSCILALVQAWEDTAFGRVSQPALSKTVP
jgi:glycosyltransferase involved in cell wall biosynthesis